MDIQGIARDITPPVVWRLARRLAVENQTLSAPVKDSFLEWLNFINPGMLNPGNVELFDYCFANLPSDAPVVEIGSFAGLSLNTITHLLKRRERPNLVFSVDEWSFEAGGGVGGSSITWEEYRRFVIETFRRNVSMFSRDNLPHHIVSTSDRFFADWNAGNPKTDFFSREIKLGGPISFAYIDGDHTYEQSLRDFQNVDKYLEIGGFVVFDDSADGCHFGSRRTASEAASRRDYHLVDRRPNYCIQKIG